MICYMSQEVLHTASTFLSFPSGRYVGSLTGFLRPEALCSDSQGDVFVVDNYAQQIVEYAHGGSSPIETLSDSGNSPNGCAVDPLTNNLAVVDGESENSKVKATIAIFKNAQGRATVYTDSSVKALFYCTYDDNGKLFTVLPYADPGSGELTELPEGSTELLTISVDHLFNVGFHAIQWDGTALAVEDRTLNGVTRLYQVHLSGSSGKVVGITDFPRGQHEHPRRDTEFWIYDGSVVAPESYNTRLGIWAYPRGGRQEGAIHLKPGGGFAAGLTVST